MDRNVRIAKELVRLAKSLVANEKWEIVIFNQGTGEVVKDDDVLAPGLGDCAVDGLEFDTEEEAQDVCDKNNSRMYEVGRDVFYAPHKKGAPMPNFEDYL